MAGITGEGGRVVRDEEFDVVEKFPFDACELALELRTADHCEPTITGFLGAIEAVRDRGPVGTDFGGTCVDDVSADDGRIPRGFDVDPADMYATAFGSGGCKSLRPSFTCKIAPDCLLDMGVGNAGLRAGITGDISMNLLLEGCIEGRGTCMARGPEGMISLSSLIGSLSLEGVEFSAFCEISGPT
jgi:hypothetical protein